MTGAYDAMRKWAEQQAKQRDAIRNLLDLAQRPVALPRLLPPPAKTVLPTNRMMADTLHEDTKALIEQTESKLEEGQHLVALYIDRSGAPVLVSDLGYHNPNMMVIWGTDIDGNDCSIITHMASFEIQLKVIDRQQDAPRRKIGFVAPTEDGDEDG